MANRLRGPDMWSPAAPATEAAGGVTLVGTPGGSGETVSADKFEFRTAADSAVVVHVKKERQSGKTKNVIEIGVYYV